MPTVVELAESRSTWEPPPTKPLDEAVWQAWVAKSRAQEQRSSAMRVTILNGATIAVLLVSVGLWSYLTPFEVLVRFLVAAGAIVAMARALQARHYAFAALFGALALLYNPVVPVFGLAGNWQRALTAATIIPFVASLRGRNVKQAQK